MLQKRALDILKSGRNVYLTGAAGSGKTHTLNEYVAYLKEREVPVAVTASTGIAATHIGGVTIHSWSGVGVKDYLSDQDIEYLTQKEYLWKRFDKARVLVIDEVSMLSPELFDCVDRVARAMKRTDKPFGGMQVVLSGDFYQLPPIKRGSNDIAFIPDSRVWNEMDVRVCYLHEQFRHDDQTLEGILNDIRGRNISGEVHARLSEAGRVQHDSAITPTRLFAHNADVDTLNLRELEKLSGEERQFEMKTKGRANMVEALKKGVLAPETLRLKKQAVVMFVKNGFDEGYVNGTLGVVEDFENGKPVVRTAEGRTITAEPVEWSIEEDGKKLASVEQIPLRLAWAITIHKSQGMSMDAAEVDLSKAFVPGQGYVALSRLRKLEGLFLRGYNDMALEVHPDVARLDEYLQSESEKWEKVIARFSDADMGKMHREFVVACGGTCEPKQIEKNRAGLKNKKEPEERTPTHEKTRALLEEGLTLEEVASRRGCTIGTILNHCEKLKEAGANINFSSIKPASQDLQKIRAVFSTMKDDKLKPVYKKLGGVYSYEDIRRARLFL